MRKIKVGLIQQSNTSDIRVNLMNLAKSIEACAAHGAQLIVLQELHNSLYFCQTENTNLFDLAETIPGPSTGFYSELAAANKVVLVTSLFEKRAPGLYHNTAVVFDNGTPSLQGGLLPLCPEKSRWSYYRRWSKNTARSILFLRECVVISQSMTPTHRDTIRTVISC